MVIQMKKVEQYVQGLPSESQVRKAFETALLNSEGEIITADVFEMQGMMLCFEEKKSCTVYLSAKRTKALWELLYQMPDYKEILLYYEEAEWQSDLSLFLEGNAGAEGQYFFGKKRYKGVRRENGTGKIPITSKKDFVYKELKEIKNLSGRIRSSGFLLEGDLLVRRALLSHLTVHGIYITEEKDDQKEILSIAEEKEIPVYIISKGLFAGLTESYPVPSIAAYTASFEKPVHSFAYERDKNLLIVDCISNPDNLGMILRTADASGVDGVVLLGGGIHYLNRNVIRGARGAVGKLPIYYVPEDEEKAFLGKLQKQGFQMIGMSARVQNEDFFELSYKDKVAFIVGNESHGVRKEILEECNELVRIPMACGQSSLNIAISAALVMYEFVRKR